MRDYGKVSPKFWTGETGRKLRLAGQETQLVALYLLTCPSSNMIGLFYLPIPTLCHETGLCSEGASEALARVSEVGFATWDQDTEHVFVVEMAAYQIGEPLAIKDNRVKGIIKEWNSMSKSPFYKDFHRRYAKSFHLPTPLKAASPYEAPTKPLRSQEQEQEQEQEQKNRFLYSFSSKEGNDPSALLDWARGFLASGPSGLTDDHRCRLLIFGAWERAVASGDDPVKLFVWIVANRKWAHITGEQEIRAMARLAALADEVHPVSAAGAALGGALRRQEDQ